MNKLNKKKTKTKPPQERDLLKKKPSSTNKVKKKNQKKTKTQSSNSSKNKSSNKTIKNKIKEKPVISQPYKYESSYSFSSSSINTPNKKDYQANEIKIINDNGSKSGEILEIDNDNSHRREMTLKELNELFEKKNSTLFELF